MEEWTVVPLVDYSFDRVATAEDGPADRALGNEVSERCAKNRGLKLKALVWNALVCNALPPLCPQARAVLAAVTRHGHALQHAAPEFRANRRIVLRALEWNGCCLEHASEELRGDREIAAVAVGKTAFSLQHVSEALRDDPEIVGTAVEEWGYCLQFASARLRADRAIVMLAVCSRVNSYAIDYASPELQRDPDLLRATLAADPSMYESKRNVYATRLREAEALARALPEATVASSCSAEVVSSLPQRWEEALLP
jgi:hypothetical protein